jgi:hypothetical protein
MRRCGGLASGQLGVLFGEPGVGKSALLIRHAIRFMMLDQNVLHVSLSDSVERVRLAYDELYGLTAAGGMSADQMAPLARAERFRMIHAYRPSKEVVSQINDAVSMLRQYAQFDPRMVIVDGTESATLEALKAMAVSLNVSVWATISTTDTSFADVRLDLVSQGDTGRMLLQSNLGGADLILNAQTLTDLDATQSAPHHFDPTTVTLYSGGATGSESAFGEAAEASGVKEVNFTFEGHVQERAVGARVLSAREMSDGDVSLLYVSERLQRSYSEGSMVRHVLKALWHMVSRSQQVFIVGLIQSDDTVRGGTGWSVELAKMWGKDLWVFDQGRDDWFFWKAGAWHVGLPVITATTVAGTGTRVLEENGKAAITSLFTRSFLP